VIEAAQRSELASSTEINDEAVDSSLDAMLAASLRPVCVGLALFYALLTSWYLVQYGFFVQTNLSLFTGLFSLALLTAAVWFERNQVPAARVRLVTASIAGAIVFHCLFLLVSIPNPRQTTNLMIAQLGFGCLLLSVRWFMGLALCSILGWTWVAGDRISDPDWRHFGLALLEATVFGGLVLFVRIRAYRNIQSLRMRDQFLAKDLQEANHAVLCAARAKTEFLANMSHEIRTPMTAILGMTELLQMTPLDEQQTEYASTIERSGDTLLQIVNDILDFSKIEAGRLAIEDIGFELKSVLDEVLEMLDQRAREKQLSILFDVAPELPLRYRGDPTRIKQVLINLVGNAIKFTHSGHVRIVARGYPIDDMRAFVELAVEDTGIGIPEDQHERVFEAFTQADTSTTRRYGGTGLGLAISTRLVRLLGGEIKVDSKVGVGSIFTVTLVLKVAHRPSSIPAPIETVQEGQYHGRILVVEDNLDNQTLAQRMLRYLGCEVEVAHDGQLALERLEHQSFDMILMDCHMPNLNGYEATQRIRRREAEQGKHTIIVALSASVLPEEQEHCLQVGMDDYVAKPFSRQDLQRVLQRWLAGSPRAQTSRSEAPQRARTTGITS
jgi:signal transduction histidine kinase/CheY-like chemotaxis protein